ncbi:MAG: outer membrane beta-barrel protein, partial [Elusimicrobia bacterium]|nr:outer membrane beta-barrel protein [Elusimicrobiota bacterium]
ENNENKAVGTQLAWAPPRGWSATYNTFWGQEVGNQGRFFNDLVLKTPAWGRLQLEGAADYGIQHEPSGSGVSSTWYGGSIIGRFSCTDRISASAHGALKNDGVAATSLDLTF